MLGARPDVLAASSARPATSVRAPASVAGAGKELEDGLGVVAVALCDLLDRRQVVVELADVRADQALEQRIGQAITGDVDAGAEAHVAALEVELERTDGDVGVD